MTVLEKIKRCVELVWDFEEIYDWSDIEAFCGAELGTYPQHDEILDYFKQIEELEKENTELKEQLIKAKEIIKELMSFSVQLCDCRHTVDFEKTREEVEQFLNEVEK